MAGPVGHLITHPAPSASLPPSLTLRSPLTSENSPTASTAPTTHLPSLSVGKHLSVVIYH